MSGYLTPGITGWENNKGEIDNPAAMTINNSEVTTVSCSHKVISEAPFVILDYGRKTTGYLFLEVESATAGAMLHIQYGPLNELMPQVKVIDLGRVNGKWVDTSYIACRFMKITLSIDETLEYENGIKIKIKQIGLVFSAFPCVWSGSFESDNTKLNDIWETGAYTVQLCMQKNSESSKNNPFLPVNNIEFIDNWKSRYSQYVIFDGPRRDRETWLGDIRTEALSIHGAFNASQVVKSSLEIFMDLQRTDGTTPGCGSTWQEFKEYNLWWVVSVWECYLFTGDKAFLEHLYPGIKRFLNWLEYQLDERGFLFNDGNWMWTLPREGHSSATQCILYYTLQCASAMEESMGNSADSEKFIKLSNKTKDSINAEYWDNERGIYFDNLKLLDTRIPVMSDVNCYAVTFGIAKPENCDRILDYLRKHMWTPYGSATLDYRMEKAHLDPTAKHYPLAGFIEKQPNPETAVIEFMYPHNRMIWPFINGYEVESRFVAGDTEGAFELIDRCWGNMVYGGTGSFWECVDTDTGVFPLRSFFPGSEMDCYNSAAHGWSGWISYILQAYVLGIRPLTPGFAKTLIEPNPGKLKKITGKMPTPHGSVCVKIEKTQTQFILAIDGPPEIEYAISVPEKILDGLELVVIENK